MESLLRANCRKRHNEKILTGDTEGDAISRHIQNVYTPKRVEYNYGDENDSMTREDRWGDINNEKDAGFFACDALNVSVDEEANLVSAKKMTGPELQMI